MDRYTLFDNYIKGKMNDSEIKNFEESLKEDKELSKEFQLYLTTVSSIIKEEEQDCIDFAHAMKYLTKEELNAVICPTVGPVPVGIFDRFKYKIYQWAAVIALIISGAGNVFQNLYRVGPNVVNNMIVHYVSLGIRDSGTIDLRGMSDEEIESKIPQLIDEYKNSQSSLDELDNGKLLVLAYLKLNDRSNARGIINELIDKYKDNEDYNSLLEEFEYILEQIK